MVKPKAKKIVPIISMTLFCAAVNIYWLFQQGNSAEIFIQLNLLTAFAMMFGIPFPVIKQQLSNGKKIEIK